MEKKVATLEQVPAGSHELGCHLNPAGRIRTTFGHLAGICKAIFGLFKPIS
jgi:hypothetical protein